MMTEFELSGRFLATMIASSSFTAVIFDIVNKDREFDIEHDCRKIGCPWIMTSDGVNTFR